MGPICLCCISLGPLRLTCLCMSILTFLLSRLLQNKCAVSQNWTYRWFVNTQRWVVHICCCIDTHGWSLVIRSSQGRLLLRLACHPWLVVNTLQVSCLSWVASCLPSSSASRKIPSSRCCRRSSFIFCQSCGRSFFFYSWYWRRTRCLQCWMYLAAE